MLFDLNNSGYPFHPDYSDSKRVKEKRVRTGQDENQ